MVEPGDRVAAGDILAVLDNPEQFLELNKLKLNIQRGELRSRILKRDDKLAEYQAERERVAALELQLREKTNEVDSLIVRAPSDGVVIGRRLAMLVGTYLAKGDEILAIGEEHGKELRVSVAQHDVQWFSAHVGQPLRIWLGDGRRLSATLAKLEPQASAIPPHDALGANCGGPLPVLERRAGEGKKESVHHEFLTPRFTGIVPLDSGAAGEVFSGQLGEVSFRAATESFGGHLLMLSGRWLQAKLDHLTRKV
jgi:multidrug efflux pump subunit AcrA (membrane-fusion protein)